MRKFYFIQSLKTTDPDLGNQIHTHTSKKSQSEFFDVKNRQDLFDKLDFISSELEKNKELDGIIHFHTHGNEKGIGLYDNENKLEFASWKDLRPKFRNIYLSTSKKPMLSICACKGFNISRLVPRFEPCPYDYITGSFDPIGFVDSVEGYKTFYDGILNGIDLSDNIKNINTNKVEKWQTTLGDELGRIKNLFYGDEKRKAGFEKLELFFVWYLMQKKECAYCGISETECREAVENLSKKFKSERIRGLHLEVDRQNPKGPYSDKNCVLSCYFCNNDKSDRFDSEEYKKFLYAREEYLRSIIRKDK